MRLATKLVSTGNLRLQLVPRFQIHNIWLWFKHRYPTWNSGKWKHGLRNLLSSGLILTHTHLGCPDCFSGKTLPKGAELFQPTPKGALPRASGWKCSDHQDRPAARPRPGVLTSTRPPSERARAEAPAGPGRRAAQAHLKRDAEHGTWGGQKFADPRKATNFWWVEEAQKKKPKQLRNKMSGNQDQGENQFVRLARFEIKA